jgi:hypothetical protein
MNRPRNERVAALHAQSKRALVAQARAARTDAREPGEPAVEPSLDDGEPPPDERLEPQPLGDPRRQADNLLDGRVVGRADRDRAAHREAEQDRPGRCGLAYGGPRVRHAPIDPLP